MQNITRSSESIDLRVLARSPYRGIQKQIAAELGLTSGAVNRRLRLRDALVLGKVVQKMLEINDEVAKVEETDRQLSDAFAKAAQVGSHTRIPISKQPDTDVSYGVDPESTTAASS